MRGRVWSLGDSQSGHSAGCSAGEDLGLLRRELLVGQDALSVQLTELLELGERVVAAGRRSCGRGSAAAAAEPAAGPAAAHLLAWRRDTLLDTWVAVPAMTAVRATPRMRPGMSGLLCASSVVDAERGEQRLDRDSSEGDQLTAATPDRCRERRRPAVLVHQEGGGAAALDRCSGLVDVVLAEDAGGCALEDGQVELPSPSKSAISTMATDPSSALVKKTRSMQPDDAAVDQVDEDREPFTGHLVAGELDDDVVDRSHLVDGDVRSSSCAPLCSSAWCLDLSDVSSVRRDRPDDEDVKDDDDDAPPRLVRQPEEVRDGTERGDDDGQGACPDWHPGAAPRPARNRITPMSRWIQPQVVVSNLKTYSDRSRRSRR